MRAVVVYESMFGNTHLVAEAVARGLADLGDVVMVPVGEAAEEVVGGADILVVGGPTHAHGMSRERSRAAAVEMTRKPGTALVLDPDAEGPGLRDWFETLAEVHGRMAASFDTRGHAPAVFTGRASKGIARQLRRHGFELVAAPESFFVTGKTTHLERGEAARAEAWGRMLAATVAAHVPA